MRLWLPAGVALATLMAERLPSPQQGQVYRVQNVYTGLMSDAGGAAVRACDSD